MLKVPHHFQSTCKYREVSTILHRNKRDGNTDFQALYRMFEHSHTRKKKRKKKRRKHKKSSQKQKLFLLTPLIMISVYNP